MALLDKKDTSSVSDLCETYRRIAKLSKVPPEDVEDVVQEAMVAVLESEARSVAVHKDADAYRTGIIYKKIMDYHRARHRQKRWMSWEGLSREERERYEPLTPFPDPSVQEADIERTVRAVGAQLNPDDRALSWRWSGERT